MNAILWQNCTNTLGGFVCGCNMGYVLDSNDGATCNGEHYMKHTHTV